MATLKAAIQADGGWEWMTGFGSDSNTTSWPSKPWSARASR
ncbi:MAG: hypothetical protein R2851_11575 [Caldilineaceae bacterium]